MRIAIAGPVGTGALREFLGLKLEGAPAERRETPLDPLTVELVKMGHEVHLITLDPSVKEAIRISEGGLTLHILPSRGRARDLALSFFSPEIEMLKAEFQSIGPDIVHAHWTYEFAEAAVQSGLPHLVTMHDSPLTIFYYYRDAYRFFRLLMAIRTMPRIKALAVVSPYLIRQARLHGYFGKICTIPNGVNLPAFRHDEARPLRHSPFRIVTVGDSGRLKNVSASVAAFAGIRLRFPEAELHLFGPGLDGDFVANSPGVHGHGTVSHTDLMRFFAEEATLLIHPSLEETFGVTLVEAMSYGIPCIAGRSSGGVSYVIGSDLSSLLVDVRKPELIANKAIATLSDRPEYERISEKVSLRAKDMFSRRLMAENCLDTYCKIIAEIA